MKNIIALSFVLAITISVVQAKSTVRQKVNCDLKAPAEFIRTGNPNRDLENYAKINNISKREAKKILQNLYGEPKKPEKLFTQIAKTGNPELDLKNFALENNLSLEKAKEFLYETFGEPEIY